MNNIITKISKINKEEKLHVLKILKDHSIPYTKNNNGYYFNLYNLQDDIYKKLNTILELIETNRNLTTDLNKKRTDTLEKYKVIIEERYNNSISKLREEYISKITKKDFNITLTHIKKNISKERVSTTEKYHKDSVFYRLTKIMRAKRKKEKFVCMESFQGDESNNVDIDDLPDDLPDDLHEDLPDDLHEDLPEDLHEDLPEDLQEDLHEDLPEDLNLLEEELNDEKISEFVHSDNDSDVDDELNEKNGSDLIEKIESYDSDEENEYDDRINHYKTLLNFKGYNLVNNGLLKYEDYIQ
jgi:hypothetical protein